jgi:hypothetical protein
MTTGYLCTRCREQHAELPFSYEAPSPTAWSTIPEADRARRGVLGGEQCVIDGQHHFVKARLLLPVADSKVPFEWVVWVALDPNDFKRMSDLWKKPGREKEPGYPALLATRLPGYARDTVALQGLLHTRPVGERPVLELEQVDHPLVNEQKGGITRKRVQELAELVRHGPQQ